MKAYRVRITSELRYYELCGLLAIGPPEDGLCPIYEHPRKDLTLEQSKKTQAAILGKGEFDPEKWIFREHYDASKIL